MKRLDVSLIHMKKNAFSLVENLKKTHIEHDSLSFNGETGEGLRYIGGCDVSFIKDTHTGVGCIVILNYPELEVIHIEEKVFELKIPYIPGYLGLRESPILCELIEKIKTSKPDIIPQVLFVDGNGTLHPYKFGLACYVGVTTDIPSIGIGKNFLHIEGEFNSGFLKDLETRDDGLIIGNSGYTYGSIVRNQINGYVSKPIFVSPGHKISVETSKKLTQLMSPHGYRIPEPIRQADHLSRKFIKNV
jgi:deoxyinosine 3'endonuclease (endonuclease V)